MDIRTNDIKILGRIVATTVESIVADAEQIYDSNLQKDQATLNNRFEDAVDDTYVCTKNIAIGPHTTQKVVAIGENQDGDKIPYFMIGRNSEDTNAAIKYTLADLEIDIPVVFKQGFITDDGTVRADKITDISSNNPVAEYDTRYNNWSIGSSSSDLTGHALTLCASDEGEIRSATIVYDYLGQEIDVPVALSTTEIHLNDGAIIYDGKEGDLEETFVNITADKLYLPPVISADTIEYVDPNSENVSMDVSSDGLEKSMQIAPDGQNGKILNYAGHFNPFVSYADIDNITEPGVYFVQTIYYSSSATFVLRPYCPAILFVSTGNGASISNPDVYITDEDYVCQTVFLIKEDGTTYTDYRYSMNKGATWDKSFDLNFIASPSPHPFNPILEEETEP